MMMIKTYFPIAFDNAMATPPEAVQLAKELNNNNMQQDVMLKRAPDMAAMVEYWDKTDDIIAGLDAMVASGQKWMPKFDGESDSDYRNRLKCAKMTNVYSDAIEGLAAKPFEQEVSLGNDDNTPAPEQMDEFIEDVDGSGNNLTMFASEMFFNGINSAIHWVLIDHPPSDPNVRTLADAKASGARPYWTHILGRNVLEATSKMIKGSETLLRVRIYEPGKPDHVRVFIRDDNGTIRFELYEKRNDWRDADGGRTQFWLVDEGTFSIDQIPMVPFITGRRDGRSFKIKPPMKAAAELQINLYQNESALEWNKRISAYSMLSGQGVKPDVDSQGQPKKLTIGPNKVLYAPPNGQGNHGEWKFIQPDPQILVFLAADIKSTIQELRELGRQPLTAQMGITVISSSFAANKAKSAVAQWALGLKNALENVMVVTAKYMAIDATTYDPVVKVYTDFDEFTDGKDLATLDTAVKEGKISDETYRYELKRRGVLSDEFDEEQEVDRILKQTPNDGGVDTQIIPPDPNNPTPEGM